MATLQAAVSAVAGISWKASSPTVPTVGAAWDDGDRLRVIVALSGATQGVGPAVAPPAVTAVTTALAAVSGYSASPASAPDWQRFPGRRAQVVTWVSSDSSSLDASAPASEPFVAAAIAAQHASDLNTYGPAIILPTGVAATDTAAIQAAHDALPATGGDVRLGVGTFVVTADVLTFAKPIRLRGAGQSSGAPSTAQVSGGMAATKVTEIQCASATGTAITLAAGASGCLIENFSLVNTSGTRPSAGAGIAVTADTAGVGNRYQNLTIRGFYRCLDHLYGHEWSLMNSTIYDYAKTGIRIANIALPDGGDMGIMNSQIYSGPTWTAPSYGVEWRSGGGLRFMNNKMNSRGGSTMNTSVGIYLHPDDGIATSVFEIVGNSFENIGYGVYADDTGTTGTGEISKLVIGSNEFLMYVHDAVVLARTTAAKTHDVVVTGNMITQATNGIYLSNCQRVTLSGNHCDASTTTPLNIQSGVTVLKINHADYVFTTAARPAVAAVTAGSSYFDTTLGKPAWSNGTNWRDAAGTNV